MKKYGFIKWKTILLNICMCGFDLICHNILHIGWVLDVLQYIYTFKFTHSLVKLSTTRCIIIKPSKSILFFFSHTEVAHIRTWGRQCTLFLWYCKAYLCICMYLCAYFLLIRAVWDEHDNVWLGWTSAKLYSVIFFNLNCKKLWS